MYPKYTTRAILVHSYLVKEKDKAFVLLTERFGILHARAISLRSEVSKLKHRLSSYTLLELTLIRGKSGWRILEVQDSQIQIGALAKDSAKFFYSLIKIVLNISPQEEANKKVFDLLVSLLQDLTAGNNLNELKHAFVYEILSATGYAKPRNIFEGVKLNKELFFKERKSIEKDLHEIEKNAHMNIGF